VLNSNGHSPIDSKQTASQQNSGSYHTAGCTRNARCWQPMWRQATWPHQLSQHCFSCMCPHCPSSSGMQVIHCIQSPLAVRLTKKLSRRALGLYSFGLPWKRLRRGELHWQAWSISQARMCCQVRSLTVLCIATTWPMSCSLGSQPFNKETGSSKGVEGCDEARHVWAGRLENNYGGAADAAVDRRLVHHHQRGAKGPGFNQQYGAACGSTSHDEMQLQANVPSIRLPLSAHTLRFIAL